jgi:hypothetical protein
MLKGNFWRLRYASIMVVGILLMAFCVGFMVPLLMPWYDEKQFRGLYWFFLLAGLVGLYMAIVGAIGLFYYLLCFTQVVPAKHRELGLA